MSQLLQNALYGTVMILVVAVLRRALRDHLVPGARLALWAACLFRLLTPAAPESVLSLWGLSRLFAPERQAAPAPASPSQLYILPQAVPAPRPDPGISWETVLLAAWLAVGGLLAARYVLSWRRTRRAVACAIPLDRDDPRYSPLPKCARLREGPMEGAPLTFGALRPTVVLSPGLDGDALDCVLAHEGVHAARRDNLWHYATALALAVHWWNPAVWLMSRLLRRDIELSCDRAALKRLGEDRRTDYAQALVSLATQGSSPAFCQTFGRKAAEERIISIMKFKKTSIIGVIFTLSLVLAVTVAFASEPKTDDGTVQFHGQTFQRDQLSQETLDWLDWYLALPEEQQLAVSYIPAELNPGSASGVHDAYDSKKVNTSVSLGEKTPADYFAGLPDKVQDLYVGMFRDEVHALLGEPSFSSSRPFSDTYELDSDSPKRQLGIFYDVAGAVTQVKYFSDGTDTSAAGIDLAPYLASTAPSSRIVSLPDIEATKGIQSDFPEVDPDSVDWDAVKAMLDKKVADGVWSQEEADAHLAAIERMVEQARRGELKLFRYDDGDIFGSSIQTMYYKDENGDLHPIDPDATASGYVLDSRQDVNEYDIKLPTFDEDAVPVPSAGPEPITAQPLGYSTNTSCGVDGCTEARPHQHQGDQCVLANPECPVEGCTQITAHQHNGRWYCFMHYVCPVEGCTITGDHIHDGVVYGCNGAGHSSGVCDGSCHLANQASTASASVSTHHSESHHSGGHH